MSSQTHPTHPIEQHPDLMALRAASEDATSRPVGQAVESLSLLAGLYLAVSPWIVGFHASAPALTANNLITGLVLVALSLGVVPAFERTHGLGLAAAAIGVWTVIAQWVIQSTTTDAGMIISNVVIGAIVFLCAIATLGQGMQGMSRGHGYAATGPTDRASVTGDRPMPG